MSTSISLKSFILLLVFLPVLVFSQTGPGTFDSKTFNGVSISIDSLLAEEKLRGLSLAVVEDYETVWVEQWGITDIISGKPINEKTVFSTASISKPVTALVAAILEEKGKIDLSKPVNDYLKRWKLSDNNFTKNQPVTLYHLLSHTAGTTQHGFTDYYNSDDLPSLKESLEGRIPGYDEPVEVIFEPGTSWKYSGGGYTLVQMALEDHLNTPLHKLASEHLFEPLQMTRTSMIQPQETQFFKNVAKAHNENGTIIQTGIPITPQVAASGMWSTPEDMAKLLIEIQKALAGKGTILSQNTAKKVTEVVTIKVGGGWSYGFERFGYFGNQHWFSHGGANTGTGGYIYGTMEGGNAIAMFGNGPNSIREPIINTFRDKIISSYGWEKPFPDNNVPVPKKLADKIKGNYFNPHLDAEMTVEFDSTGILTISPFFTGPTAEGVYIGEGLFQFREFPNLITFRVNPENETFSLGLTRKGLNEVDFMFSKRN
ncbi:beta-lactamase family protein [Rhodohalobacter sp. WB101]|uniref:Beta-lactamase family protein n=2 Tax=Rhodohalobacter sulfatireducens TaxID=2911366 RepID=A0ABS9KDY8_9BACT|nr:serine hydrolase domain-containing protein [Rhodohalobacter sulfatireducens]MCG2589079.1 beta-lactamase family protein [Rhodohalobacter sulfatireducens]